MKAVMDQISEYIHSEKFDLITCLSSIPSSHIDLSKVSQIEYKEKFKITT